MPYKSAKQMRYFNAHRAEMEAQGVDVDEWNRKSKGKFHHRLFGGPVRRGRPYVVGEDGEELFVPKQDGVIIPNNEAEKAMLPNLLDAIFPRQIPIGQNENWDGRADERAARARRGGFYPGADTSIIDEDTDTNYNMSRGLADGQPVPALHDWNPERFTNLQVDESLGQGAPSFYPGAPKNETASMPLPADDDRVNYGHGRVMETDQPTGPSASFYPGASTSSAAKSSRERQDEFEAAYPGMSLEEKQQKLIEGKAPVEHNFLKRMLKGALRGLATGGLGGAIAGAGAEGFFPSANRAMNARQELGQVNQQIAARDAARAAEQKARLLEEQIKTIPTDDLNRRLEIAERQERGAATRASNALNRITKLKYFDLKNQAHQRLAKEAGLDVTELQGWDDRNPVEKSVAGVSYRLNRQTGQYEPTNLPADEAKVLTDYEVTMPNGEKRQYKVSQRDAASFSTQMSALGARLEESQRQRDFQANEAQKSRQFQAGMESARMQAQIAFKQLADAQGRVKALESERAKFVAAFKKETGITPTEEQINEYLSAVAGQ